jgi:parallel beta-helix repeat protein
MDQGMSSISNFAVNFYIARTLGAVQYGAFALAYVTYSFMLNASRGLGTDPLLVRFSGTDIPTWRRAVAGCTGTAAAVGVIASACVLAAAAAMNGTARLAFFALGLTLPGLLLQDSWRFAFFAQGRGSQALLNDTIWVAVLLPALVLLRMTGHANVFWFVFAWGASGTVAACAGPLQARVMPRLSQAWRWVSQHRDLGPRYLAEGTANSASAQFRNYGIGLLLGLAAVGYIQAGSTLMGPFMVIFFGMGLVTLPEAARLWRDSPHRMPVFCLVYSGGLAVIGLAWGVVLLVILPRGFGHWLLGSVWRPTYPLVLPLTLSIMGGCLGAGAGTGLHALAAARRSLRAMLIASALNAAGGLLGAVAGGPLGAVRGLAISTWLGTLVYWWQLRAALRDSAVFTESVPFWVGKPTGRHRGLPVDQPRHRSQDARHRRIPAPDRAASISRRRLGKAESDDKQMVSRLSPRSWAIARGSRLFLWLAIGCGVIFVVAFTGLYPRSQPPRTTDPRSRPQSFSVGSDPGAATRVCGQPILKSPYNYHGRPGHYHSGTPGLPSYGRPGSDFPHAKAGVVLPAQTRSYLSYQLTPHTVYYLLPGTHTGGFQADSGDAFVGGFSHGVASVLSGNYSTGGQAIDSNSSAGNQPGVTIEYLTIEEFQPAANAAAVNQEANTGWRIEHNTITRNVPGAGVITGTSNVLEGNCLTLNGQYGFQAVDTDGFGRDPLTGGPYNVTITGNEISYNDTCDFSGLLTNPRIGWSHHDPVPPGYRDSHCGQVVPDGDQGGFKLWRTNGVSVRGNYIHDNWGPGAWVDTDNANTTISGNTITRNEDEAIVEEISYNFAITGNYLAANGWTGGLGNSGFPTAAIYISESGSDTTFGGVPACREAACAGQRSYPRHSVISGNTMLDNGGNIFLWQSADRYCGDGVDEGCTLVHRGPAGPFTPSACRAHLPSARIDTTTYQGRRTGAPLRDWWDGCLWRTENVDVDHNVIDFDPGAITDCNDSAWPDCGAGGMYSDYGSAAPYKSPGGWVIPTQLTFFQHNNWWDNTYKGPSTFYAWNQGNGDNPVSWAAWTGHVAAGDKCGSPQEHSSGYCLGPFGQDAGSTYNSEPARNGSDGR